MEQYIKKSALVAEIERLKDEYLKHSRNKFHAEWSCGTLDNILSFLNTIEMKEEKLIWNNARTTVPEDSTNQIICIKEDGLAVSTVGKIVNGTIKWAYLDDLLNTNSFNVEVKEVNLEKELDSMITPELKFHKALPSLFDVAKHFFELGLKVAQKGEEV